MVDDGDCTRAAGTEPEHRSGMGGGDLRQRAFVVPAQSTLQGGIDRESPRLGGRLRESRRVAGDHSAQSGLECGIRAPGLAAARQRVIAVERHCKRQQRQQREPHH